MPTSIPTVYRLITIGRQFCKMVIPLRGLLVALAALAYAGDDDYPVCPILPVSEQARACLTDITPVLLGAGRFERQKDHCDTSASARKEMGSGLVVGSKGCSSG